MNYDTVRTNYNLILLNLLFFIPGSVILCNSLKICILAVPQKVCGRFRKLSLYRDEDVKNKDKRFFFANKLICFLNVSDFTCSLDYVKGLKMQKR